ncbi:MAG: hypothetical protein WAL98_21150 [Desulfatiglandaceae bacterium]
MASQSPHFIFCRRPAEAVSALTPAKFHFISIASVYWKDLAGLRTAGSVNKASPAGGQQGTGQKETTAGTALTAGSLTDKELALDICLTEMNQIQSPEFACSVTGKSGFPENAYKKRNPLMNEGGEQSEYVWRIAI